MQNTAPLTKNEIERLLNLSDFEIDYSNLENNFKDLILLAAKIAGTEISLINIIDSFTQWTVANYGLDIDQLPRENSICQYTILEDDYFEVEDLSKDDRFLNNYYVKKPHNLRYYFGIPLKTNNGYNLGALCVMDSKLKKLNPKKIELLKLVANEILVRLNGIKKLHDIKNQMAEVTASQKRVAHDIRGPINGIIGITDIIKNQGVENTVDELLEMVEMINKSGKHILDLADEILNVGEANPLNNDQFNFLIFKEKLEKLYKPQAKNKHIFFSVTINPFYETTLLKKDKLLQIAGNLISNAIKFTPDYGIVKVNLDLLFEKEKKKLYLAVDDTGLGLDAASIKLILDGNKQTSVGTFGEKGYGFGLSMVKEYIESVNGKMNIKSELGKGSKFEILIPM